MFAYGSTQNTKFPGPESEIIVSAPNYEKHIASVTGIVDTGAVMTCIPQDIILALNRHYLNYSQKDVQGPFGGIRTRKSYFINIKIGNCLFENIEVLSIEKHYAVIGRDLLNNYKIFLDPINKEWSVTSKCH